MSANQTTHITQRERQVLNLTRLGHQRSEIAKILGVSTHAVDKHRQNMFRKTDTHSAEELVKKLCP